MLKREWNDKAGKDSDILRRKPASLPYGLYEINGYHKTVKDCHRVHRTKSRVKGNAHDVLIECMDDGLRDQRKYL